MIGRLSLQLFWLTFLAMTPLPLVAGVFINEIAWMGTNVSANDEWIELYNDGVESVDITGWTLTGNAGANSLSISLSGTIAGMGYFLLERTDDESVAGVTADQIYTGALSNSGDTLSLNNLAGISVYTVSGGENWESIGGDNTTKDTPQRANSGSWVTAPSTPRSQNSTVSIEPKEETESGNEGGRNSGDSTSPSQNNSSTKSNALNIVVNAGSDRVVSIGADTVFEGSVMGENNKPIQNARYVWNFGDGKVAEGKKVLHAFIYPGEYVVVLTVSNTGNDVAISDSVKVSAEEALVEIAGVSAERITIRNIGVQELDLSYWILRDETGVFILPEHTRILPKGELVLANSVTGLAGLGEVVLAYPSGSVVAEFLYDDLKMENAGVENLEQTPAQPKVVQAKAPLRPPVSEQTAVVMLAQQDDNNSKETAEKSDVRTFVTAKDAVEEQDSKGGELWLWLLALMAVIGTSVTAVMFIRKEQVGVAPTDLSAEDFEIIEDAEK